MIWIFAIMLAGLTGTAVFGIIQKYGKTPSDSKIVKRLFLAPGLFLVQFTEKWRNKRRLTVENRYLSQAKREEIYLNKAASCSLAFLVLFLGVLGALSTAVANRGKTHLKTVERPAFGEEKNIVITVKGLSREEDLNITVLSKTPDNAELEALFDQAFAEAMEEALAGNVSFDELRHDLSLPETTNSGVELYYKSEDPEIISSRGIITAEDIPESGLTTALEVIMRYETYEKSVRQPLIILPQTEELDEREQLMRLIDEANEQGRESDVLVLPESFDEHKLSYETKKTSPWIFLLLAFAAAAVMVIFPEEKRKDEEKQREQALILSYPGLVSRLGTLIMANLSIRSAWERIIKDRSRKDPGSEPLAEEMMITWLQLNQGVPEGEAYVDFGRRTGLRSYQRLGNLLKNNLRQGISGLESALQKELQQALTERKNTALILGEKAGTRLLMPMLLMLLVIIATLVVPAFFAF